MKIHQCQKNKTQGSAWIDCFVALSIFGAISGLYAVTLPLMSSTSKAKQVEARNNIGGLNRAQQVYFEEKKGAFAGSIEKLGIGIKSETNNYRYLTQKTNQAAFNYAISKVPSLKSYVGAVWIETTNINGKKEDTTRAIICEAKDPGMSISAKPVYENGGFVCPESAVILGQ